MITQLLHNYIILIIHQSRRNIEKQGLFEHMETVMLLLDELVDGG